MRRDLEFIWGPGGVGKTHFSIREAYMQTQKTRLITLDPSPRLFEVLNLKPQSGLQTKRIKDKEIELRQTDADALFKRLSQKQAASPKVRDYYQELVGGLHRFRDYLSLIDLADEIKSPENFNLIVDTPPLSEAHGLNDSIQELHRFFRSPFFQMGMKSQLLQAGFKKTIELAKSFLGKLGVEQALDFVDWLNQHIESFRENTKILEELIYHEDTQHCLILCPESSLHQIRLASEFFKKTQKLKVILNRSLSHLPLPPESAASLRQEIDDKKKLENECLKSIKKYLAPKKIELYPLRLMGSDTHEELLEFLDCPTQNLT